MRRWRSGRSWNGDLVYLTSAPITAMREVARGMSVVTIEAPEVAASVRAGQFVNLGLAPGPLLRRPFSVYRAAGHGIEVILKAVGTGTSQLLGMRVGDRVSCLGPLGHGFDLPAGRGQGAQTAGRAQGARTQPRSAVLVSGGLGVAPMPLAAREAHSLGMRVTWVHGARSSDELCSEWDGDDVIWATDDGSKGFAGTAVAAAPDADIVMACGPNQMLAAVAKRWPDAQVAVETYMGCGTGVCLGCAVPLRRGGYDRACKEGPVYRAADVDWDVLPSHLPYAVSEPGARRAHSL
jgi:dihydroorotate dehydrogenase electron transfer subunit